ncbi:hypothetical protein F8388_008395 [Cannabis sativa]|uniref:Uncharacterized protein n=1 Tax=Cannabis sativa TaxID=3483 RepID=A0A7J6E3N5_CANSA|nr:hypothetical protein F8388_008395 [Cannabis sativa]
MFEDEEIPFLDTCPLIILCSWKSIGGAIDSFTVTTFDANHCPGSILIESDVRNELGDLKKMQENEPGKQVKSAVRLSNTSKYHVAFKVLAYIHVVQLISPASIVAKMNGQDSICKADLEEVTSLYHDRCIIMKKGGYWVAVFVLPTEWTDQFESGIQTIAVIQAGHGLLQLGSCKIVIIIMACYELESQFLYLSFSLVSSLPVESLSVAKIEADESRLREVCESFLGPPTGMAESTSLDPKNLAWDPFVLGIRKHKLLREDILPAMATNRKVQRLLNEFMDILSEYESVEADTQRKTQIAAPQCTTADPMDYVPSSATNRIDSTPATTVGVEIQTLPTTITKEKDNTTEQENYARKTNSPLIDEMDACS